MSPIAWTLLLITLLFVVLLVLKRLFTGKIKVCAICLAVSMTWVTLLLLRLLGYVDDSLVIGILMGQSSLGVYYLLEKNSPRELLVFRLPVVLTLTLLVFTVVSVSWNLDAWLLVVSVWLVIGFLYLYRNSMWAKTKVKAMIECCSNW